jgi:transposase
MEGTDLYRHLLGIASPWEVTRVELSVIDERVDVWAIHAKGARFACPECHTELAGLRPHR